MNHICGQSEQSLESIDVSSSGLHTCGSCGKEFHTICYLHQHMTAHNDSGAYYYDTIVRVAFPKLDSTCKSTQTVESQTNYFQAISFIKKYRPVVGNEEETGSFDVHSFYDKSRNRSETNEGVRSKILDEQVNIVCEKENNKVLQYTRCDEEIFVTGTASNRSTEKHSKVKEYTVAENNEISQTKRQLQRHVPHRSETRDMALKQCSVVLTKLEENSLSSQSVTYLGHKLGENVSVDKDFIKKDAYSNDENNPDNAFDDDFNDIIETREGQVSENKAEVKNQSKADCSEFKIPSSKRRKRKLTKNNQKNQSKGNDHKKNKKGKTSLRLQGNRTVEKLGKSLKHNDTNEDNMIDLDEGKEVEDDEDSTINSSEKKSPKYFVGQQIVKNYVIQRIEPTGIFNKGETDESKKVQVDETWIPDANWSGEVDNTDVYESDNLITAETWKIKTGKDVKQPRDEVVDNLKTESKQQKRKKYGSKKYVCTECGKTITKKEYLIGHMNNHAGLKPFICDQCGKPFANNKNLQVHVLQVHSDKEKWFKCDICEYRFPTRTRLARHMAVHTSDYTFQCDICNKSYTALERLKIHIKFIHCKKRYRCKNCKLTFDTKEEVEAHQKTHAETQCDICSRQFSCFGSLARHKKIHLDLRAHQCHICLRRFLQKTPFWVHMEKHHDLTKSDLIKLFPEKHLDKHYVQQSNNVENESVYENAENTDM